MLFPLYRPCVHTHICTYPPTPPHTPHTYTHTHTHTHTPALAYITYTTIPTNIDISFVQQRCGTMTKTTPLMYTPGTRRTRVHLFRLKAIWYDVCFFFFNTHVYIPTTVLTHLHTPPHHQAHLGILAYTNIPTDSGIFFVQQRCGTMTKTTPPMYKPGT